MGVGIISLSFPPPLSASVCTVVSVAYSAPNAKPCRFPPNSAVTGYALRRGTLSPPSVFQV